MPRLSVVVPAFGSEQEIGGCLEALEAQTFRDFETIVVDSAPGHASAQRATTEYPVTRIVKSPWPLPPHAARNVGAELADGDVVVFTDPDCRAEPDWLAALVEAHGAGHPVVGGAVEPAAGGWLERGVHLAKFCPWLAGGTAGARSALPSANLSWSRDAWRAVGPFRVLGWSGDTELCWRARAAGIPLRFQPAAVVRHHQRIDIASFCWERFQRGAAFARVRLAAEGWSRRKTVGRLAASPLVPFILTARCLASAARSRQLSAAVVHSPVLLVGFLAWTLGEALSQATSVRGGATGDTLAR